MESSVAQSFSTLCGELGDVLYIKAYDKGRANALIDELIAKPYKGKVFVREPDATLLITSLCLNIKPNDEFLATKASHLIISVMTKQNLLITVDNIVKALSWHYECLKKCSDVVLADILHNTSCLVQYSPEAGFKLSDRLIGREALLLKLIETDKNNLVPTQTTLQITLLSLKCIGSLSLAMEDKKSDGNIFVDNKDKISQVILNLLMKGYTKGHDEILYYKVVMTALRVLSQIYFNWYPRETISLPDVIGVCRYYLGAGLVDMGPKPERIMPSQQPMAPVNMIRNTNSGKKQKVRRHRNTAIESLKKEIPVSDRNLSRDIENLERSSAYKPISQNYLEPQARGKTNVWTLTSDSDLSDVESGRDAKLVAMKSRVRQSASHLLLVIVKIIEKKDMYGYWWALLPDAPDTNAWTQVEAAKKSLAYFAVTDPISNSRASVLSVILALLTSSKQYLFQAESSKKETVSFTPFSVSLGYIICCMHKVLVSILDNERIQSVVVVALKCMAALVQATPYHRMKEGLIADVVRSSRKYLLHRDFALQVGALITVGCVVSIDPKVDEVLKSIEKEHVQIKKISSKIKEVHLTPDDECDDFDEICSDDEMFVVQEKAPEPGSDEIDNSFSTWILDICLRNLGWVYRDGELLPSPGQPALVPVKLESLQVLSSLCYHYYHELIARRLTPLSQALCHAMSRDHRDVALHAAIAVSVLADATRKSEQTNNPPPLQQCLAMWELLLPPLSAIFQADDAVSAKVVACDCIANIGQRVFKELPRRSQVLCCTLLVGSCGDAEGTVRAAAVRALAMAVFYHTLREDIGFVSDCGENILRTLTEPSLLVRSKAAWALGNLSEALVLNADDPTIDDIDDDLLVRLLDKAVQCSTDNDKIKMSATRGIGNFLRLVNPTNLSRATRLKPLCEEAIERLVDCSSRVSNMKVRWNSCYAIGNAMKNEHLFVSIIGWQRKVFLCLCTQSQDCKNIKVRINAAAALRSPSTREQYGEQFATVWRDLMSAMESAVNIDDFSEYMHKDNLIEQLFVTLSHMCRLLRPSDLQDIYDPLVFHHDTAKALSTQLCHKLPPENASCVHVLEAAKHLTVGLTAVTDTQKLAMSILQDIFIWDM